MDKKAPCGLLTIGIKNGASVEQQIKKLLPQCECIGAEPIASLASAYKIVGKYNVVAVGNDNGKLACLFYNTKHYVGFKSLTVYDKDTGLSSTVNATSVHFIAYVLMQASNWDVVDYLILDAEGAEEDILSLINDVNIVKPICQFDVELHLRDKEEMLRLLDTLFLDIDYFLVQMRL